MPFTPQEFFHVFARYNAAVWPMQLVLVAAAIPAVALTARGKAHRYVLLVVAALWVWTALAYHAAFFRHINPAAVLFAAAFLVQAALLLWYGIVRGQLQFGAVRPWRTWGLVLMIFALLPYHSTAMALGHRYPEMPTFGLPCPTAIFTLGVLMSMRRPQPLVLWIIPLLWVVPATQAAVLLGVYEDFVLTSAAIVSLYYLVQCGAKKACRVKRTHKRHACASSFVLQMTDRTFGLSARTGPR